MMKKLLILITIFALSSTANALIFSDNFDRAMTMDWGIIDYQGAYMQSIAAPYPGGPRVIGDWDGYQSLPDPVTGISPTIAALPLINTYNLGQGDPGDQWFPWTDPSAEVANGVLHIVSSGGAWADGSNSGAFLYKNVAGDFEAKVEVVAQTTIWHNCGGLMARAANPSGAGASENWVYLSYFPVWGVGNHARNCTNGVSPELGISGYPPEPYLKLTRVGTTFFLETSADGVTYAPLAGLEAGIDRPDLPGDLQVGIWQANYTSDWPSFMDFDNFSIGEVIPEPATITLLGLGGLFLVRRRK